MVSAKSTANKCAEELASRYGLPTTREILVGMLELAYQTGKIEGAQQASEAVQQIIKGNKST